VPVFGSERKSNCGVRLSLRGFDSVRSPPQKYSQRDEAVRRGCTESKDPVNLGTERSGRKALDCLRDERSRQQMGRSENIARSGISRQSWHRRSARSAESTGAGPQRATGVPEKIAGVIVLDPHVIAISNDNDFDSEESVYVRYGRLHRVICPARRD
jgi:hypothetical protein